MIYILYAPSRPFRYKIGITNNLKRRIGEIKRSEGIEIRALACFNIRHSRYYEKLPKPTLIATQEYVEGKIYYRNPAKEKEKLQ